MKTEMEERSCPKCGRTYTEYPALSRTDNKTLICPDCGIREVGKHGSFQGRTGKNHQYHSSQPPELKQQSRGAEPTAPPMAQKGIP